MSKVCVIGHFGFGKNLLNGQTIKAKIVTEELEKQLGREQVTKLDTCGGKKRLFQLFFKTAKVLKDSNNVIIMPANNGLKFFAPALIWWNKLYRKSLHYVVIGGWLPQFISDKPWLSKLLKKFNGIYVEMNTMKTALEKLGFNNVIVMPNCKELKIISDYQLEVSANEPIKVCTFSRVMKEKGIEDAINAVVDVNRQFGKTVYRLDIYGQVDEEYAARFESVSSESPDFIQYKGIVPYNQTTDVLKDYYALLFPTYYNGEGFAGTLLDAFAAGVPVIASDWRYNPEIVINGVNGLIYPSRNNSELIRLLVDIYLHQTQWIDMRSTCIDDAKKYMPQKVIKVLVENMR